MEMSRVIQLLMSMTMFVHRMVMAVIMRVRMGVLVSWLYSRVSTVIFETAGVISVHDCFDLEMVLTPLDCPLN